MDKKQSLSTVDPADLRKTSCYSNVGHGDLTLSEASRTRRKVFCRAPPGSLTIQTVTKTKSSMLFVYFFEMALFGRFLLQTQFPVGQVATARYFNPHWWNQGHSIKSTQLVQRGSLLLLAVTASLMLAFRRHACRRRCGNGRWKTASWCKPERTCRTRKRRAWPAPLPPARRSPALRSWRALSTDGSCQSKTSGSSLQSP